MLLIKENTHVHHYHCEKSFNSILIALPLYWCIASAGTFICCTKNWKIISGEESIRDSRVGPYLERPVILPCWEFPWHNFHSSSLLEARRYKQASSSSSFVVIFLKLDSVLISAFTMIAISLLILLVRLLSCSCTICSLCSTFRQIESRWHQES